MRCSRAAEPTKGRRSAPDGKDALDLTRLPQPAPRPRADLNACDCVRRQVRAEREPDRAASLWASRSDAAIARRARRRKALKRMTPRALQMALRDYRSRRPGHAPTSTLAIASEGRFERSENLIAQRASGRVGAMQRSRAGPAEGRAPRARPPRALQINTA